MKVDTDTLQTVKNYSLANEVTTSYIYKLIREQKLTVIIIDGVQFIDIKNYPVLPTKKK
jgi:predicted ATP-dependent serine protease